MAALSGAVFFVDNKFNFFFIYTIIKIMIGNFKYNLLVALLLLAVGVFVFGGFSKVVTFLGFQKIEATKFVGQVVKVEGNNLFLKGFYTISLGQERITKPEEKQVQVVVTSDTEIIKTSLYLPKIKDLSSNGSYKVDDLKKEISKGSLEELKSFKSQVSVHAGKNIFNKNKFEAKKIEYIVPIFPN